MRIAILYDCLYPYTVGGAEHWYRKLSEFLDQSHDVTFVTRRQWDRKHEPEVDFSIEIVSGGSELYTRDGVRRLLPPLRYGLGVFFYLLRNSRKFDVVSCASFPYFSLLGAWLALRLTGSKAKLIVDWFECWTRDYWIRYSGPLAGRIGYAVQKLCLRITPSSMVFSKFVAKRIRSEGYGKDIVLLPGLYTGSVTKATHTEASSPPYVIYAGRHTSEKRVTSIPEAIVRAREIIPNLRCKIYGDGPERRLLMETIEQLAMKDHIECLGFVERETLDDAMRKALCLVLPSEREGYGMVVVEAAAQGTPVVVSGSSESSAADLIEEGANGFVSPSVKADDIAQAIVRVHSAGNDIRESTADWFNSNLQTLSMNNSFSITNDYLQKLDPTLSI